MIKTMNALLRKQREALWEFTGVSASSKGGASAGASLRRRRRINQ